ncbi:MAG: hypothetical protein P5674_25210, partial [Limnospira sp. PMC 289.06]|nr:hypothetical protein [Limnospira sp. PMC 289.06]
SSRNIQISLVMDGWQWSDFGNRFSLTPSVPRFSPRVVIPQTGGGYRRYSQLPAILGGSLLPPFKRSVLTLGLLPCLDFSKRRDI